MSHITPSAASHLSSMTGYASGTGGGHGYTWTWDLRSVNGKGFDLRLRVPDWIDGFEQTLRAAFAGKVARGNVTLNLRVMREDQAGVTTLNTAGLENALTVLGQIEAAAQDHHLPLAPMRATDIAAMRGVLEIGVQDEDTGPLKAALLAEASDLIANLQEMRATEGAALHAVLERQLGEVEALVQASAEIIAARRDDTAATMRRNLLKVAENTDAVAPERVAQELALIAVKSDVTEEIDRLTAHIASARDLLGSREPVGRKLDFLMQEFNREANTLCSKAQHTDLTQAGLALKVLIDQMREQVQNVE